MSYVLFRGGPRDGKISDEHIAYTGQELRVPRLLPVHRRHVIQPRPDIPPGIAKYDYAIYRPLPILVYVTEGVAKGLGAPW